MSEFNTIIQQQGLSILHLILPRPSGYRNGLKYEKLLISNNTGLCYSHRIHYSRQDTASVGVDAQKNRSGVRRNQDEAVVWAEKLQSSADGQGFKPAADKKAVRYSIECPSGSSQSLVRNISRPSRFELKQWLSP